MDRHAATRRLYRLQKTAGVRIARMHPHMLRHTFVTTMLDAGVDLRDVQIAARHADPRTTMRYDRARKNLDRHPNYILAAYMASGTWAAPMRQIRTVSARRPRARLSRSNTPIRADPTTRRTTALRLGETGVVRLHHRWDDDDRPEPDLTDPLMAAAMD